MIKYRRKGVRFMKTIMFGVFLLLMFSLIFIFIRDTLRKGKQHKEVEIPSLHRWVIPAIIASLVAQELISQEESSEFEGSSMEELEEFLLTNEIFFSKGDLEDWMLTQPELVGFNNSEYGGLDLPE
jgi:hypothetical protein